MYLIASKGMKKVFKLPKNYGIIFEKQTKLLI